MKFGRAHRGSMPDGYYIHIGRLTIWTQTNGNYHLIKRVEVYHRKVLVLVSRRINAGYHGQVIAAKWQ